jgi:hypothetical protein
LRGGLGFLIGLIAIPLLYGLAGGVLPKIHHSSPVSVIIAGGLLVGIGTRMSGVGGCSRTPRFAP